MAAKTKTPSRPAAAKPAEPPPRPVQPPPLTTEERLRNIEAMRQRINGYVEFMCAVGNLNGTSAEAKEVAVAAFLSGQISFTRIAAQVEDVLAGFAPPAPACLSDVLAVDGEARARTRLLMETA